MEGPALASGKIFLAAQNVAEKSGIYSCIKNEWLDGGRQCKRGTRKAEWRRQMLRCRVQGYCCGLSQTWMVDVSAIVATRVSFVVALSLDPVKESRHVCSRKGLEKHVQQLDFCENCVFVYRC